MNLTEKLIESATIIDERIIKIDHLINHNINIALLDEVAQDIVDNVNTENVTKVLTIETGGIALAVLVALKLNNIDVVYAKKDVKNSDISTHYLTNVNSFTREKNFKLSIDKRYLNSNDKVLIVDDFLATGSAYYALVDICNQANCEIINSAFIFNKTFQNNLTENVYSVVSISSLSDNIIKLV